MNDYANMGKLMVGLNAYMSFYNTESVHHTLRHVAPDQVYRTGVGLKAQSKARLGSGVWDRNSSLN